jgi:hypothetical protein
MSGRGGNEDCDTRINGIRNYDGIKEADRYAEGIVNIRTGNCLVKRTTVLHGRKNRNTAGVRKRSFEEALAGLELDNL